MDRLKQVAIIIVVVAVVVLAYMYLSKKDKKDEIVRNEAEEKA